MEDIYLQKSNSLGKKQKDALHASRELGGRIVKRQCSSSLTLEASILTVSWLIHFWFGGT